MSQPAQSSAPVDPESVLIAGENEKELSQSEATHNHSNTRHNEHVHFNEDGTRPRRRSSEAADNLGGDSAGFEFIPPEEGTPAAEALAANAAIKVSKVSKGLHKLRGLKRPKLKTLNISKQLNKRTKKNRKNHFATNFKGKVIDGLHELYTLTAGIMLGIRYSAGNPSNQCQSLGISDFNYVEKVSFPAKGNNSAPHVTPAHSLIHTFKFKSYAPAVFARIREFFGIDAANYMMSVCGDYNYVEFISNSKSGQFFFYSHDGKYMLKTQTKEENKFMKRILPHYYKFLTENPHSMLVRILGMHRVKMYHLRRKVHFVIMTSVFDTPCTINTVYDLKGSVIGRSATEKERNSGGVLKDNDLIDDKRKFHLGCKKAKFMEQLSKDAYFLASLNIMDYSLLVGVHDRNLRAPPLNDNLLANGSGDAAGSNEPSLSPATNPPNTFSQMSQFQPQLDSKDKELPQQGNLSSSTSTQITMLGSVGRMHSNTPFRRSLHQGAIDCNELPAIASSSGEIAPILERRASQGSVSRSPASRRRVSAPLIGVSRQSNPSGHINMSRQSSIASRQSSTGVSNGRASISGHAALAVSNSVGGGRHAPMPSSPPKYRSRSSQSQSSVSTDRSGEKNSVEMVGPPSTPEHGPAQQHLPFLAGAPPGVHSMRTASSEPDHGVGMSSDEHESIGKSNSSVGEEDEDLYDGDDYIDIDEGDSILEYDEDYETDMGDDASPPIPSESPAVKESSMSNTDAAVTYEFPTEAALNGTKHSSTHEQSNSKSLTEGENILHHGGIPVSSNGEGAAGKEGFKLFKMLRINSISNKETTENKSVDSSTKSNWFFGLNTRDSKNSTVPNDNSSTNSKATTVKRSSSERLSMASDNEELFTYGPNATEGYPWSCRRDRGINSRIMDPLLISIPTDIGENVTTKTGDEQTAVTLQPETEELFSDGIRGNEIYYLGIIDILQQYNFHKYAETKLKGMTNDQALISSVDSVAYAKRFIKFMEENID